MSLSQSFQVIRLPKRLPYRREYDWSSVFQSIFHNNFLFFEPLCPCRLNIIFHTASPKMGRPCHPRQVSRLYDSKGKRRQKSNIADARPAHPRCPHIPLPGTTADTRQKNQHQKSYSAKIPGRADPRRDTVTQVRSRVVPLW